MMEMATIEQTSPEPVDPLVGHVDSYVFDVLRDDPIEAIATQVENEARDAWGTIEQREKREHRMLMWFVREYGDEPEVQSMMRRVVVGGEA